MHNDIIKMLHTKLAPNKASNNPLEPHHPKRHPMLPQLRNRKDDRLNRVRPEQKVEESVLDPGGGLEGGGRFDEDVVVEERAGCDEFAPRGEQHDYAADCGVGAAAAGWVGVGVDFDGGCGGHGGDGSEIRFC